MLKRTEMKEIIKKLIPGFLLSWYHFLLAFFGAFFYGFPSRKMKVIGVTGTNGKSTTVELIAKILEEAEYKTAVLSSIKFKIGDKEWKNLFKMTMPGRFTVQKILRQAARAGCQYFVLEVTSEGIKQHRHCFIDFEAAVFTNLTPEHIESHGSFEKYREAKGKLFQAVKNIHIINLDDKNAKYFLQFPSNQKFCYSLNEKLDIKKLEIDWKLEAELYDNKTKRKKKAKLSSHIGNWKFVKAADVETSSRGIEFTVNNTKLHLRLLGGFNVYNALAAICLGLSEGIDLETCQKAIEKIEKVPGRMEQVISEPFKVIVDYAVTPDALENLYQIIKKIFSPKRMIAVFGSCGGGRDKWRRPVLGEIAAKYCDEIIVTNEDPYDEDPMEIIEQIAKGVFEKIRVNPRLALRQSAVYKILDRRAAIRKALELAKPGDVVVITGKGCEPWICLAHGRKISWDDRKVVKEEFNKINE